MRLTSTPAVLTADTTFLAVRLNEYSKLFGPLCRESARFISAVLQVCANDGEVDELMNNGDFDVYRHDPGETTLFTAIRDHIEKIFDKYKCDYPEPNLVTKLCALLVDGYEQDGIATSQNGQMPRLADPSGGDNKQFAYGAVGVGALVIGIRLLRPFITATSSYVPFKRTVERTITIRVREIGTLSFGLPRTKGNSQRQRFLVSTTKQSRWSSRFSSEAELIPSLRSRSAASTATNKPSPAHVPTPRHRSARRSRTSAVLCTFPFCRRRSAFRQRPGLGQPRPCGDGYHGTQIEGDAGLLEGRTYEAERDPSPDCQAQCVLEIVTTCHPLTRSTLAERVGYVLHSYATRGQTIHRGTLIDPVEGSVRMEGGWSIYDEGLAASAVQVGNEVRRRRLHCFSIGSAPNVLVWTGVRRDGRLPPCRASYGCPSRRWRGSTRRGAGDRPRPASACVRGLHTRSDCPVN